MPVLTILESFRGLRVLILVYNMQHKSQGQAVPTQGCSAHSYTLPGVQATDSDTEFEHAPTKITVALN